MSLKKVHQDGFGLEVLTDVDSFEMVLPLSSAHLFNNEGVLNSRSGAQLYSYKKKGNLLQFTRSTPVLSVNQDLESYAIAANVALPDEYERDILIKRIKSSVIPLNGSVIDYVVNQAIAIGKKFPYSNELGTDSISLLEELGAENKENVCRHIAVLNSVAYELNNLPHRTVDGSLFISDKGTYEGHEIVQILTEESPLYFDPTYISDRFTDGFMATDMVEMVKDGSISRPFYETVCFDVMDDISFPRFQQILNKSTFN